MTDRNHYPFEESGHSDPAIDAGETVAMAQPAAEQDGLDVLNTDVLLGEDAAEKKPLQKDGLAGNAADSAAAGDPEPKTEPAKTNNGSRKAVVAGLLCLALAGGGLLAANWNNIFGSKSDVQQEQQAPAPTKPATIPDEKPHTDGEVEHVVADTDVQGAKELTSALVFGGMDVSADPTNLEISVANGRVIVSEISNQDIAVNASNAAIRSAAFARNLIGKSINGDEISEVVWSVSGLDRIVQAAVISSPNDAPAGASTAEAYLGSLGWDMTEEAFAALAIPEVAQTGGAAAKDAMGNPIVPGISTADGILEVDPNSIYTTVQKPVVDDIPAETEESSEEVGADEHEGQTWVVDVPAHDEPIYEDRTTYEKQQVKVGEEPVYETKTVWQTSDGQTFDNEDALNEYLESNPGLQASMTTEQVQVDVVEVFEEKEVAISTERVQVGTRHVEEQGHWE